jgi:hypothetical protein
MLALGSQLQVFVVDVDSWPTLAFEASDLAEAREICRAADLRDELMAFTSNGAPVCTANSTLAARAASHEEIAMFRNAVEQAPACDLPTMTFLIKVDGVMVVAVGQA